MQCTDLVVKSLKPEPHGEQLEFGNWRKAVEKIQEHAATESHQYGEVGQL